MDSNCSIIEWNFHKAWWKVGDKAHLMKESGLCLCYLCFSLYVLSWIHALWLPTQIFNMFIPQRYPGIYETLSYVAFSSNSVLCYFTIRLTLKIFPLWLLEKHIWNFPVLFPIFSFFLPYKYQHFPEFCPMALHFSLVPLTFSNYICIPTTSFVP